MEEFIKEPERLIRVSHKADVVVCGGGTAGIAAAICAGRLGLKVVMVETSAMPGGMITQCINGIMDADNKGGIVKELLTWLETNGYLEDRYPIKNPNLRYKYNPFYIPPYLDQLLAEANVHPLYLSMVVDVIREEDRLAGVIIESKSGRTAVLAPLIIDATGDGDVAVRAGADYRIGRDEDNACQAISHAAYILEYNGEFLPREEFEGILKDVEAKANRGHLFKYKHFRLQPLPLVSTTTGWFPHVTGYDPTDVDQLSQALIELRRQAWENFSILKKYVPQFKNASFGPMAAIPGIRESRRIVCDETITIDDALSGRKREDGIFTVAQNVDIHRRTDGDPDIILKRVTPYYLPYGSLLPKGLDNFLVVGRCIGGDHEAQGSYRIAGDCMAMGEAAAIASFLARERGCKVRDVPASIIAEEMQKRGYLL